jgi:hypothetical protein
VSAITEWRVDAAVVAYAAGLRAEAAYAEGEMVDSLYRDVIANAILRLGQVDQSALHSNDTTARYNGARRLDALTDHFGLERADVPDFLSLAQQRDVLENAIRLVVRADGRSEVIP